MLQITDEKELALYLDPWEESLLNFVLSQIYMEFSKSIQSMKKHYFYSHQKPTKLAQEICLIPTVLWGKLKKKKVRDFCFTQDQTEDGLKFAFIFMEYFQ